MNRSGFKRQHVGDIKRKTINSVRAVIYANGEKFSSDRQPTLKDLLLHYLYLRSCQRDRKTPASLLYRRAVIDLLPNVTEKKVINKTVNVLKNRHEALLKMKKNKVVEDDVSAFFNNLAEKSIADDAKVPVNEYEKVSLIESESEINLEPQRKKMKMTQKRYIEVLVRIPVSIDGKNLMSFERFYRALLRVFKEPGQGAYVGNALLEDLGILSTDRPEVALDRKKVQYFNH